MYATDPLNARKCSEFKELINLNGTYGIIYDCRIHRIDEWQCLKQWH